MTWQWTPLIIPLVVGTILLLAAAISIYRRGRYGYISVTGALLLVAGAEWMLTYALELAATARSTVLLWSKMQWVGIAVVPTLWFVFLLRYTGHHRWVTPRILALLSVVPLITIGLAFTNEYHHLIWAECTPVTEGSLFTLDKRMGPAFGVFMGYSYVLVLSSTGVLIYALFRSPRFMRWHAAVLLLAVATAMLSGIIETTPLDPWPQLDLTPLTIAVNGPIVAWSLTRLRLENIVPVAYRTVIEGMSDAVVVLDVQARLVDLNPAARDLIGASTSEIVGQPIAQIWPQWALIGDAHDGRGANREVEAGEGAERRTYDVRISPLTDWRGELICRVVVLRDITERKRTEEALREAHEQHLATLNALPDLFFVVDGEGRVQDYRTPRDDLLYAPPEVFLGKTVDEVLPKEAATIITAALREAVETGKHTGAVYRLDGAEGPRWYELSISARGDPKTPDGRLIALVRDVTERRRAEEALAQERDLLHALMDNVPDTIYFKDAEGRFTRVNRAQARTLGLDAPAEAIGKRDFDFYKPEFAQEAHADERQIVESGQPLVGKIEKIERKDGFFRWVSVTKVPIVDGEGRIISIVGISRDITELKEVEEALARERDLLHALMDNVPDAIYFKDTESRFTRVNRAHAERLGLDAPAGAIGKSDFDFYKPEFAQEARADERQIVESGQPLVGKIEKIERKDGFFRWVSATKVPIIDGEGRVISIVGISRDITELKQAERELEKYRAHLEELVAQRTAELQAVNERLLALTRLKDEFVANVSHELRTPLANIKLYHHLLDVWPAKHDTYLDTLQRETKRLEHIVEDLLYLSRLDQGQVALERKPVDLNVMVASHVADRTPLAEERKLALTFSGALDLPAVQADSMLLERVLSVLLTNAINYTPAGGRIEVHTHVRCTSEKHWAGFSVSDTGLGISPDEQSHLFERFYRGKAARESGAPGTGLGLATAQEIVERHEGRLEVESEGVPGEGATFTVWLPVSEG